MTACMGLCEAFAAGVRKHSPDPHTSPHWAAFVGRLERQDFFEPVWVSQASRVKISYTNPLYLTSSMVHPKGRFILENGGDTWGRK